MGDFLILRTIIKIAAEYSDVLLHCQEVSLEGSCSPWIDAMPYNHRMMPQVIRMAVLCGRTDLPAGLRK